MTAQKHLKDLVRSRMKKTGESYCSARRYVIRGVESPPGGSGAAGRGGHLPGCVPATTALRILLTAAGVRDPRTRQPFSEEMVFGIAGGIGVGVASFLYEKEDFASLFAAGRHLWHDDAAYLTAAFQRFGIKPELRESSGAKAAEKHLRDSLAGPRPCIAFVDMANLPHRGMPAQYSGGGYHVVTVHEVDDRRGVAFIGDLTDTPIEIRLQDLATARGRIKKFKNRLLAVAPASAPSPLAPLVRSGLAACHAGLSGKPKKGMPGFFNLDSLKTWATRLNGSKDKEGWERVFPRGHRLWQGLTSIYDFIENYGTGGGLCRPLFADFLAEAGDAIDEPCRRALSKRYAELGRDWSALAEAALPDHVARFREVRELYARRGELLAAGDPANAGAIRDVWDQLLGLQADARKQFPLLEAQCAELRAELQRRVRALHEAEVAAHAELGKAL
jgi:hypothetical protein